MRIASLAFVSLVACGGGSTAKPDAPPTDGFDRNQMLDHLANQVLLPLQLQFATAAAGVAPAIVAHCDALDQATPGTTLETARAAWATAVDAWEAADAMLVGPAAGDSRALRD